MSISICGLMMAQKELLKVRLEYLEHKKKIIEQQIKDIKEELKGY